MANEDTSDTLCFAASISFVSSSFCLLFLDFLLLFLRPLSSVSCPLELVTELYPRRPQLVEQKALPLLWYLLGPSSGSVQGRGGSVRRATTSLCQALHDQMGPGLVESASSQPPSVHKDLNELLRTMS